MFFDFETSAFELVALNTCFTERQYFSWGVIMFTNNLKIADPT